MHVVAVVLSLAALLAQSPPLKIVVIAGEDAVNVIQQKPAVAPVVEVRDRSNLPVAGATVMFTVDGAAGTFAGSQTLTVVTNAAGQATAAGLSPTATGALRISARATFQGQSATATITQSNVMTAADAARAARSGTSAEASGGGMSFGKILAIAGGIAAVGAGAAVAAGSKGDSPSSPSTTSVSTNPTATTPTPTTPPTPAPTAPPTVTNNAPVITSASITPNVAMIGLDTAIALQVQASDPDNDSLSYLWEFPDGSRSEQQAFTRIFHLGGTWNIRVSANDGKTSTSSALSLEMKTMAGTWGVFYFGEPNPRAELALRQTGTAITGEWTTEAGCTMTGFVRAASPQVTMIRSCVPINRPTINLNFSLNFGPDVDTLIGTSRLDGDSTMTAVVLRRTR